ncbi:hypothetical protein BD408DRAFT_412415 [Parasitella parasitica]|nr:hypothetical protein BD408DRAFT_412415 [Parasitella parasitica]
MSPIDQSDLNNFTTGSIHPHYKNIPLDLTVSPLEEYFRDMHLLSRDEQAHSKEPELFSDNTTAASSEDSLIIDNRAKPILIPGKSIPIDARLKRRRGRRERLSKTVPNTLSDFAALQGMNAGLNLAALPEETEIINPMSEIGNSTFTVGSLVDRPPVPWPASITAAAHDGKRKIRYLRQKQGNDGAKGSINEGDIFLYEEDNDEHESDHISGISISY